MNQSEYRCPLTKLIYYEPVLAEDGHIYEKMAIEKWFDKNKISPLTGAEISKKLNYVIEFKRLIDKFLETHPEMHNEQFLMKRPYNLFRNEFNDKLRRGEFNDLDVYTEIFLNDNLSLTNSLIKLLSLKCNNYRILKEILDNSIDYDTEDSEGLKPVHYIIMHCEEEMILFMMKKDIDRNYIDRNGKNLMHYLCMYHPNNPNLLSYFIDLKIDSNVTDIKGNRPIHYLAKGSVISECFHLLISKGARLDSPNKAGWTPFHIMCRDGKSYECIKLMMDEDMDIRMSVNTFTDEEITCEKLILENKNFNKNEKQDLAYHYLKKVLYLSNIDHDFIENQKLKQ